MCAQRVSTTRKARLKSCTHVFENLARFPFLGLVLHVYMGQFPQDGENVCFTAFLDALASLAFKLSLSE